METIVLILVNLFQFYLLTGALFAVFFIMRGLKQVDHSTEGSSIWFKLLIFPGLCALWPLFLIKWLKISR